MENSVSEGRGSGGLALWYLCHGHMRSDSHDRVDVNVKVAAKLKGAPRLLQRMSWPWWYVNTLHHKVRGCNGISKGVHPYGGRREAVQSRR